MHDETRLSPAPVPQPTAEVTPEADTEPGRSTPDQHAETLAQTPVALARAVSVLAPSPTAYTVPGYEILGELGRGGMGVVYRARQVKLNRVVALKMVLGPSADARESGRFLLEAEAVAAIRHPNVIQVYDSGEADGRPYMAMECLEGGSLVARLRSGGKLQPYVAAELVMKIALGVQAAHERGIVHRDLKPHNILFQVEAGASGPFDHRTVPLQHLTPKVTDFGLAKRGASELTQTGAVMGTPAYMAPEQARGETKNIGPAADVYALGIVLYECLTGTVPFTGDDAWSVIRQVVTVEPEPVTRRTDGVPLELDLICLKCLEKVAADRYASAAALADDLGRVLKGEAIRGPRTDVWYAAQKAVRRWWRPVAVAAMLVALVLVAWLLPSPLDKQEPDPTPSEDRVIEK